MLHVSLFCRRLSSLRSFFFRFCSRSSHTLSFSCRPFLGAHTATPLTPPPVPTCSLLGSGPLNLRSSCLSPGALPWGVPQAKDRWPRPTAGLKPGAGGLGGRGTARPSLLPPQPDPPSGQTQPRPAWWGGGNPSSHGGAPESRSGSPTLSRPTSQGRARTAFLLLFALGPLRLQLPLPERVQAGALVLEAAFVLGVVTVTEPASRFRSCSQGSSWGGGGVLTTIPWDPRLALWGSAGVETIPREAAPWLAGCFLRR